MRPLAVCPWSPTLGDPARRNWTADAYDLHRLLVHIDCGNEGGQGAGATLDSKIEFYTAENRGLAVGQAALAADDLDHDLWVCIDWHYGNGRDEAGGSYTQAGRYHRGSGENAVESTFNSITRWPEKLRDRIKVIQWGNEPANAEWMANLIANWIRKFRGRCQELGWEIAICEYSHHLAACSGLGQIIDSHPLFMQAEDAGRYIAGLRRLYPRLKVYASEMAAGGLSATRALYTDPSNRDLDDFSALAYMVEHARELADETDTRALVTPEDSLACSTM